MLYAGIIAPSEIQLTLHIFLPSHPPLYIVLKVHVPLFSTITPKSMLGPWAAGSSPHISAMALAACAPGLLWHSAVVQPPVELLCKQLSSEKGLHEKEMEEASWGFCSLAWKLHLSSGFCPWSLPRLDFRCACGSLVLRRAWSGLADLTSQPDLRPAWALWTCLRWVDFWLTAVTTAGPALLLSGWCVPAPALLLPSAMESEWSKGQCCGASAEDGGFQFPDTPYHLFGLVHLMWICCFVGVFNFIGRTCYFIKKTKITLAWQDLTSLKMSQEKCSAAII